MTGGEEMPAVTLARIEGKLDLINAGLLSAQVRGDDHETRLRALESNAADTARVAAVEARTAALELRPEGITPAKFLTGMVGVSSVVGVLATLVTVYTR